MSGSEEDTASQMRHRAANTLQLISAVARLRSQRSDDSDARRQLLWVSDVVGVLGALERHRTGADVEFSGYLEEMAAIWRRRNRGRQDVLVVQAQPIKVSEVQASTLALIVNELVANTFSHGMIGAEPRRLGLRFSEGDEGQLELVVSDDGPGFNPLAEGSPERFGLWLVRSLAGQVRGQFDLQSRQGTTARLSFPVAR